MCIILHDCIHTPVSWVLFCKLLPMISQESKKPVMFYEEALIIADASAKALRSILNFYHKLGVIL